MRRFGSALLMLALLGAAVRPAAAADPATTRAAPAGRDHLAELVGTWSCRTGSGMTARIVVQQPAPNTIVFLHERYYPAFVIRAVEPDTPVAAMQQRLTGTVHVLVSIDADAHVTGATILDSPSALFNSSALTAARESTYHTAVHDCKPIASQYVFAVDYSVR